MKDFNIPIAIASENIFFSPIRSKSCVIKLLMNTVKYINSEIYIQDRSDLSIQLVIDDMNRFIFKSENKVFSVRSPFHVKNIDGTLVFYTQHISKIDSVISSGILTLVDDKRFFSSNCYELIEAIEETFDDLDSIWPLIQDLMMFEDGYIRFDHDPEHELNSMHPLNHLDVCYTNASTFKLGAHDKPCSKFLYELLSNKHSAKYLEKNPKY